MAVKRESFVQVWEGAQKRLARAAPPALLALVGDESFVKERLIDAAAAGHAGEMETFAQRAGESDGQALDRLIDDWATSSLFGSGRMIVARDVDKLLKGHGTARLETRLEAGEPPNRLLVTLKALDGRTRFAKRLKSTEGLVSLPVMRDSAPPWHEGGPFLATDLNEWLVVEARLRGLQLGLPVADALTERVGNEPGRLAQTLSRLAVLLGERTRLEIADVEQHVSHSSARLLARYEDALRLGQVQEAVQLADRMSHDGVYDPFMKLVTGPLVTETVLRGLTAALAREVAAHDALGTDAVASLKLMPWKRPKQHTSALDAALGVGGRRVFLERDLRRTDAHAAQAGFGIALRALRGLRDGSPTSLHAVSVRLARALSPRGVRR